MLYLQGEVTPQIADIVPKGGEYYWKFYVAVCSKNHLLCYFSMERCAEK